MPDPYDSTGIQYYNIPAFKFVGGTTKAIKVAYRSFNPNRKKVVLIPTCYAGHINETLNFTSAALKDYHVVVVAMLGNGESSAPSNDPDFPTDYSLRYQDCINSQYQLLTEHLRINTLDAVIGFSMGGQQAYYWAVMHGSGPEPFVKNVIPICGSAKTSGHNYAFLEGPIAALTTSYDYHGGKYKEHGAPATQGMRAFGRAYSAWLTSAEWFRQDLWKKMGAKTLKDWIHPPAGESGFEIWDAEDILTMGRMWQAGDVGVLSADGDYRTSLRQVTARMMVMPSQTDQYFVVDDGATEVKYLKHGEFNPIPTIWGHIGGGGANEVDTKWMDGEISRFLNEGK